ncbi:hypothetical protein N7462_002563 [Penicillium macrosclerotiorum]|uniref:uncharacterized protein n=1 Tax=Penicillium macrosclerotiorum TaxID=303699 RepID=UPI0025486695|nr:uncharacterized protein N7462_002563 [Penicillium macrosclerotiorum]KAJ5693140.1 hypothetical protein N7462_002563 [Penicillium macrosclerotiorum]
MSYHQVKRPRLALSCLVCRRRKVKCGKEQPRCQNCERMGETCVYNTGIRDPQTGRVCHSTEQKEGNTTTELSFNGQLGYEEPNQENSSSNQYISQESSVSVPVDHISFQPGSRVRHIGKTFWGFVNGQVRKLSYTSILKKRPSGMPPPHISSVSLAKTMGLLPTKPVSDTLVRSFFVSVYPIHPVLDISTFQSDYDAFWAWSREGSLVPPPKLVDDPTFFCLLFAVFYAGAFVIPAAIWEKYPPPLNKLDRNTTIEQQKTACSTSLDACQATEYPTLNTIATSILVQTLSSSQSTLGHGLFVATTIRLSQSLGLHREIEAAEFQSSHHYRRRIWWHVLWLDIQSSIATGLPPCYENDKLAVLLMVSAPPKRSAVMFYAIGRYETARLQSSILKEFQSAFSPNSSGEHKIPVDSITRHLDAIKSLHSIIDGLITKIPAYDTTEGLVPASWTNASPQTHPTLYEDNSDNPGILGIWVKSMLSFIKLEAMLMLQKLLLGPPESTSSRAYWPRTIQLCLYFLQSYLQLCRTPAFEPYAWFFSDYYVPRQCSLLVLLYLNYYPQPERVQEAQYLVNEFIDYVCTRHELVRLAKEQPQPQQRPDLPSDIKLLIRLREQLDSRQRNTDNHNPYSVQTEQANTTIPSPGMEESPVAEVFTAFQIWPSII